MNATATNSILHVRTTQLFPHPDNRPLGINEEKVEQLAEMMRQNGYDQSKPLKVRPFHYSDNQNYEGYQIIEGEHRWRAAQKAGIDEVPVFVVDLDDEEALIQLVAGNAQTDSHPLDYGRIALKLCVKDSKKGLSISALASRWGINKQTLSRYYWGGEIHEHLEQCNTGVTLLTEPTILTEIRKCHKADWLWFHDLIANKGLSKSDAIEISKRIRAIDAAAGDHSAQVFDLTEVKKECATAKERIYNNWLSLIEAVEDCAGKLPEVCNLFDYSVKDDEIQEYEYEAQSLFLSDLSNLKSFARHDVYNAFNAVNDYIRNHTEQKAKEKAEYYRDEANRKEKEDRAAAEWEAFIPVPGTWYNIGPHRLYCGDNRDKAFIDALPNDAAFAFADPPYNAGVDEWDSGFEWEQDYLQDKAQFVFVTPGTNAIKDLMRNTDMNYRWALYCWIKNGMTKGALGFNNTIFIAIFSRLDSVFKNMGDHFEITIKVNETEDTYHEGRKPYDLLKYLIEKFSEIGQTVIDPFCGSGTTLLECEKTKRICIAAEKNPLYCKEIMSRFRAIK